MRYRFDVRVGPISFRVGSAWRGPVVALRELYRDYPRAPLVPDYTVRLEPGSSFRRLIRPSVAIRGDHMLPDALPLPLAQGLLAAEMGMNLQVALGERRFLLLHAASVEKGGKALILTGESGSGKSTLAALLGAKGWRFMSDEFVLIDPETHLMRPFPRPTSLKNEAIAAMEAVIAADRFGPRLVGTPKGTIRHLIPAENALAMMDTPAEPAAILFPRFGFDSAVREIPPAECFVRLTQASTNYTTLAERGFDALTQLVQRVPAIAIDYPDADTALRLVASL